MTLEPAASPSPLWSDETFHFSGEGYLERLAALVRGATRSVRIESYIFADDERGRALLEELGNAAARGVKVRLIVDAIGSPFWWRHDFKAQVARGVGLRVFGRPRDLFGEAFRLAIRGRFWRAWQTLRKFQLRDHRKLALVDAETPDGVALVGSANIGATFEKWRETTVELRGLGVGELKRSFVRSWRFASRERIPDRERGAWAPEIHNNFTHHERRTVNRRFRERIRESRRLWMTTAYFHPRPKLTFALFALLRNGGDLRILVPRESDIAWFPWLSRTVYAGLLARGARIFEYDGGTMLHAKTTLFDGSAFVGSRNMNYRSFVHDLELDVELNSPKALAALEAQFLEDCRRSLELTRRHIREYQPIAYLVSLGLTPFKRWL